MDRIDKIITESINDFINEDMGIHREPLVEMARINKNETGRCIFPYDKWEVKLWSSDHNPPHFHIICNGWDVSYVIEDGRRLDILKKGNERNIFDYMEANVLKWLDSKCFAQPKLTNRENAILQWEQIHDN